MRDVRATGWSVLAGVVIWCALVMPSSLSVGALLRIPLLGLVLVAVLLLVPARGRRPVAVTLGVALALVVALRATDIGFSVVVGRPFHVLYDVPNLARGFEVLADWVGRGWAVLAVVVLALVTVLLVGLLVQAMRQIGRVVTDHRHAATALVLVGALGVIMAAHGRGADVVSTTATDVVRDHATRAYADHGDSSNFGDAIAVDPMADRTDLLSGLEGKDVLVVFVESYGRSALTDPEMAKGVAPVLSAGTSSLGGAGFEARSGWLTSPTFGAGSWLAHATLQSGLWVDSDRRHSQLLAAERLTLTSAFGTAGWRTSFVQPAVEDRWPEGQSFYRFDRLHGADELDYHGPALGWGEVPDQYTLSWFWRNVLAGDGDPVMAQVDLVSSHNPWPQPPPVVAWDEVGDGSVYSCMPGCADGDGADDVRSRYAASIGYSLESVISFVEERADRDLVVVLVGDHQPWRYVTGDDSSRDVPVTVIAGDPAVVDRIEGWGWTPGLRPGAHAPVWRMDAFRDRFLEAFSEGEP